MIAITITGSLVIDSNQLLFRFLYDAIAIVQIKPRSFMCTKNKACVHEGSHQEFFVDAGYISLGLQPEAPLWLPDMGLITSE